MSFSYTPLTFYDNKNYVKSNSHVNCKVVDNNSTKDIFNFRSPNRSQVAYGKGSKRPETTPKTVSTTLRLKGRRRKRSKDEKESGKRVGREVKLPPLQVDTVSAKNIRDEGESRDRNESGRYIETPRRTKKLKPRRIFRD